MPLRITVDTNILISATINQGKPYQILRLAKEGKIIIVLSLNILEEFKEVISRPRFGFSNSQISDVLKHIINISEIVIPNVKINIVKKDPDDNMILEAAVSGDAKYIVSGDGDLLDLLEYRGIKILKAAEFLRIIN